MKIGGIMLSHISRQIFNHSDFSAKLEYQEHQPSFRNRKLVRLPKFSLKKLNSYTLITCENNCRRLKKNTEIMFHYCLSSLLNIKNSLSPSLSLPQPRSYVMQDFHGRDASVLASKQYHYNTQQVLGYF